MSALGSGRNKTLDMVYIAMFAVLITICSWISIPTSIPFTLQTFGVFVTVGILGGKRGTLAIFIYLLLGVIGIPVFSGFTSGIGVIAGNTGGYIIGFLFSAFFMWAMEWMIGKKTWALAFSMIGGLLICYVIGTIWFIKIYASSVGNIGLLTALSWCVFPFVIPDMVKIAFAVLVCKRLSNIIEIN